MAGVSAGAEPAAPPRRHPLRAKRSFARKGVPKQSLGTREYNLLFKSPKGHESEAQSEAFEDTWHWNQQLEREFEELLQQSNTDVSAMMQALRGFLGENDLMAYLTLRRMHRRPATGTPKDLEGARHLAQMSEHDGRYQFQLLARPPASLIPFLLLGGPCHWWRRNLTRARRRARTRGSTA